MTIVRRVLLGVIVAAVVGVWASSTMHDTRHYSDTPGQGAALERTQLPPLDTDTGGPIPLPDAGSSAATHIPAQPAAVEPPIAPPPPVTDRSPDATPQDPQLTHQPGTGSAVSGAMPGTSPFDLDSLTGLLQNCDAACLTRVLDVLNGGSVPPITLPPVTLPPLTLPVG